MRQRPYARAHCLMRGACANPTRSRYLSEHIKLPPSIVLRIAFTPALAALALIISLPRRATEIPTVYAPPPLYPRARYLIRNYIISPATPPLIRNPLVRRRLALLAAPPL